VILQQRRSVVTTSWDDGHPLDLRTADLLARYGLSGTFYVPRDVGWPTMTADELRHLSSRFEVGAHTLDHILLDRVDDDQVRNQLSGSRHWIEDVTGKPCRIFCFPGGRYRRQQLSLVYEAGYEAARTTELLSTRFPRRVNGLSLISTTVQVFPHSPLAYAKNTIRRWSLRNLVGTRALFCARDWLKLAQNLLHRTVRHGGVFHVWGHSWEIEQENQWGRLETLLAMMAESQNKFTNVTNSELGAYAD
jgi:peptidoglycan/xylan/chitin deacetylase (PgdA/CDA1 family)